MNATAPWIARNRFGLGVSPDEPTLAHTAPRRWVERQIVSTPGLPRPLRDLPSSSTIGRELHQARLDGPESVQEATRRHYRESFAVEAMAVARHRATTDTPFVERMVMFWSNHFTVSRTKRIVGPMIPAYEREAIRPHVFGRFEELLLAVVRHPAMLAYLDNDVSIGPRSLAGRRTGRSLNENLAREILELHTLGVDGGYTQDDVRELARVLTGWSHGGIASRQLGREVTGDFDFRELTHEPGSKTILGTRYPEDGRREGEAVLRDLARHPSTARFLATKLVRHFVADDPPDAEIDALAAVFLDSGGDLAEVSRALVRSEAVWAEPLPKVKTPYELVLSTLRAVGVDAVRRQNPRRALVSMGQDPFAAPSPQGWSDRADHWLSPAALMRRIEWVRAVAGRSRIDDPSTLLDRILGPLASPATRTWVERAPSGDAAVALVLASPAFQRR